MAKLKEFLLNINLENWAHYNLLNKNTFFTFLFIMLMLLGTNHNLSDYYFSILFLFASSLNLIIHTAWVLQKKEDFINKHYDFQITFFRYFYVLMYLTSICFCIGSFYYLINTFLF